MNNKERGREWEKKKSFINTESSKQIVLVIIMYPIYELKQEYGVFLFEKYSIIKISFMFTYLLKRQTFLKFSVFFF